MNIDCNKKNLIKQTKKKTNSHSISIRQQYFFPAIFDGVKFYAEFRTPHSHGPQAGNNNLFT